MTKYPIEAYTTAFDYMKHISSLCTASILLLVAFLEKLFTNPEWKFCVALSLVSFLICVVSCLVCQAATIEMIDNEKTIARWAKPTLYLGFAAVWTFFSIGLASLTLFAIVNLY